MDYVLLNPSGNVTLLVESPVAADEQPAVAGRLMAAEPRAEQVGFLSPGVDGAQVSLRMAGGEFCGNATMSAAVWAAHRQGLKDGTLCVQSSGVTKPIAVTLHALEDGAFSASLEMPKPLSVREAFGFPIVHFDGISHIIVERAGAPTPEERREAESLVRQWCETLGAEALGLMFLEPPEEENQRTLTPLVYVPSAGTCCWESACGSGSCGVAAYLAEKEDTPLEVTLKQPGGTLFVSVSSERYLTLSGKVSFLTQDIGR